MFDLPALQALLRAGDLDLGDDQQCWIATDSCWDKLEDLKWTTGNQVKKLLLALRPGRSRQCGDFVNSQWCEDSDGGIWACDSYRVNIDEYDDFRRNKNALAYYVKFSVDEEGALYLVLIQCHLDRHKLRT